IRPAKCKARLAFLTNLATRHFRPAYHVQYYRPRQSEHLPADTQSQKNPDAKAWGRQAYALEIGPPADAPTKLGTHLDPVCSSLYPQKPRTLHIRRNLRRPTPQHGFS